MDHLIPFEPAQTAAAAPGVLSQLAPSPRPPLEYGCVDWFDYPVSEDVRRPEAEAMLLDA
ncbi:MAG TPA: hypothetical protein VHZ99_06870 [Steroidobacteraceae bacterium]|jgi:hypothetical protein|nr:hypothetical protein [Steroidobacteraceae bacterium]